MVDITGSDDDRAAARDVADWCARELAIARQTGRLETRPFVQSADLIIAALREYAAATNVPTVGDRTERSPRADLS